MSIRRFKSGYSKLKKKKLNLGESSLNEEDNNINIGEDNNIKVSLL